MCMQCVGQVGTALQAATVFGGPVAYAGYRRVRAMLGLRDTSVAAVEAQATESAPDRTRLSSAPTTSAENCPPVQRRHSASASSIVSGSW